MEKCWKVLHGRKQSGRGTSVELVAGLIAGAGRQVAADWLSDGRCGVRRGGGAVPTVSLKIMSIYLVFVLISIFSSFLVYKYFIVLLFLSFFKLI